MTNGYRVLSLTGSGDGISVQRTPANDNLRVEVRGGRRFDIQSEHSPGMAFPRLADANRPSTPSRALGWSIVGAALAMGAIQSLITVSFILPRAW